jgi:hypothetical protein
MTRKQRTLKALEEQGWNVDDCERRLPVGPGRRPRTKDLHGVADLHAFDDADVLLVQVCGSDLAAHLRTVLELDELLCRWLRQPGRRFQIWAWRKVQFHGKRVRWEPRVVEVALDRRTGGLVDFEYPRIHPAAIPLVSPPPLRPA